MSQNATGNWIKVVQRVPVRIELDMRQVAANPLRVGLSMDATVDVSKQDGKTLADAPRASAITTTEVFQSQEGGAEAEVRRVIAQNSGRSGSSSSAAMAPAARNASATMGARAASPGH